MLGVPERNGTERRRGGCIIIKEWNTTTTKATVVTHYIKTSNSRISSDITRGLPTTTTMNAIACHAKDPAAAAANSAPSSFSLQ